MLNLLGLLRVEGQIVQNGQCDPNIPLATDFDFSEVRFLVFNRWGAKI